MVTVKLYGATYSTCTRRVLTTANEIGVKVEVIPVDLSKGEHKTEEYLSTKQPFGVIPVLEDEDGTKIYESRAISRYLVAKYAKDSPLLPSATDPKAYGLFEQAASVEYSSFDPSASGLAYELVFSKAKGLTPNEELAKKYTNTLLAKMDGYERILSKQKYLAGDTFTLADLFHLPYGAMVNDLEPDILSSKPSVKKWWEDITSRESWKQANNHK
ncbi:glutathione S-transferase [Ceratobasidium sp. AG-I]|nr:glutathione S-transferase [Ceratobasidium sp. AG-I]